MVANVQALKATGIPYVLVHLAVYPELREGQEYLHIVDLEQDLALVDSLRRLTGQPIYGTLAHAKWPLTDLESLLIDFRVNHHPSRRGAQFYAEVVAEVLWRHGYVQIGAARPRAFTRPPPVSTGEAWSSRILLRIASSCDPCLPMQGTGEPVGDCDEFSLLRRSQNDAIFALAFRRLSAGSGGTRFSTCPQRPGLSQLASAPHSQWQVAADNGVFWLLTPCGERFLSLGVNVVNGGYPSRVFNDRLSYHWGTFYPDLATWGSRLPVSGYWPGALTLQGGIV